MSGEIHAIDLSEVDKGARVEVLKSMSRGYAVSVMRFGPTKTGFGTRLNVPLSEAQCDEADDPGSFLELTFEQAMDLNAKLAVVLSELAAER